jgi:hypothetical protein
VGRTYAIPFDHVWTAALYLADGGFRRWSVVDADDGAGIIHATSTTPVLRSVDDVHVRIALDMNAQTRVDVRSRSRRGRGDLGRNRRAIGAFVRRLDEELDAKPEQILNPVHSVSWGS